MSDNQEFANILENLGNLLEIDGEARSRNRNLQKAADKLRGLEQPLTATLLEELESELSEEPYTLLKELLTEGQCAAYSALLDTYPKGLTDVVRVPGIGAARARQLWDEKSVAGLDDLLALGKEGLVDIRGIGAKSAEKILEATQALVDARPDTDDSAEDVPQVDVDIDLTEVPGIGAARAEQLKETFDVDSLAALVALSVEQLATLRGVGESNAEGILKAARDMLKEAAQQASLLEADTTDAGDAEADKAGHEATAEPSREADATDAKAADSAENDAAALPTEEASAHEEDDVAALTEEAAASTEEAETSAAEGGTAEGAVEAGAVAEESVGHQGESGAEVSATDAVAESDAVVEYAGGDGIEEVSASDEETASDSEAPGDAGADAGASEPETSEAAADAAAASDEAVPDEEPFDAVGVEAARDVEEVFEEEPLVPEAWVWANLRCAACHSVGLSVRQGSAECGNCGRRYLIEDGIVDMVGSRGSRTFAQQIMEFKPYALVYERLTRPILTRALSQRRIEEEYLLHADLLGLQPGQRVLDVACGPGNFTRYFAEVVEGDPASVVVGMDLSWPMLGQARKGQPRSVGAAQLLRYVRGDAARLPVADESFDRVHCAAALHIVDDIDRVLGELNRVLKPDGIAVVGTFLASRNLFQRYPRLVMGRLSGIHWFDIAELKQRMDKAGFVILEEVIDGSAISVKATRR
ncbi:MAG: methyltransferase domain-containing protein [Myxococcota bacterium]